MDDIWFLTLFDILIRLCVGGGQGALWGVWEDATGWPREGQQPGQEKGATPGQYVVLSLNVLSLVSVYCFQSHCLVLSLSVLSAVSEYCPQSQSIAHSLRVLPSVSVYCPLSQCIFLSLFFSYIIQFSKGPSCGWMLVFKNKGRGDNLFFLKFNGVLIVWCSPFLVGNSGSWEPLCRDTGGGWDLQQVCCQEDGHRVQGSSVCDDSLWQQRTGSPGGHR